MLLCVIEPVALPYVWIHYVRIKRPVIKSYDKKSEDQCSFTEFKLRLPRVVECQLLMIRPLNSDV